MGIHMFSSGKNATPLMQPNPFKFDVIREASKGNYVLALVNYPDATNFEGNKILLVKGKNSLVGVKELDPHFLKNGKVELVARFQPTVEGWNNGVKFLQLIG